MPRSAYLPILLLATYCSTSRADNIQLVFGGGAGTGAPLSIAFSHALKFSVINDTPDDGIVFVFKQAGDIVSYTPTVTGDVRYGVNGGPLGPFGRANSGFSMGSVNATDLYFFRRFGGSVGLGDEVVMTLGSLEFASSSHVAAPSPGYYAAVLVDTNGVQLGLGIKMNGLAGDYNLDNNVDAGDYVQSRKRNGNLAAINLWRLYYGNSPTIEPMSQLTPEPGSCLLIYLAMAFGWLTRPLRTGR